jgi:hypothetical protein
VLEITSSGSFAKTEAFLHFLQRGKMFDNLSTYGQRGVDALRSATPIETGETSEDWGYQIGKRPGRVAISWFNTHNEDGVNIAVIIQYGHGTGTGGWVEGRDYINPAMRPIFDKILDDVWRQVTNA